MTLINSTGAKDHKSYNKVVRIYNALKSSMHEADLEKLLQSEGDVNYGISENPIRVPSMLHAISRYQSHEFELLLNHGVDFTRKDDQNRTVVHKIIHQQAVDWNQLLLRTIFYDERVHSILAAHVKFNDPSNPRDNYGISHFHAACMTNNAEAVEFFLQNGVDVEQAVNADSPFFPAYTPLQLAVKYTCADAVEILLRYGANVSRKNSDGFSPLHSIVGRKIAKFESAENYFARTFNIFVKFYIDSVDATDDFGFCKLHLACLLQDQPIEKGVLEQVANVNRSVNLDSPVCPGYTALHFAAFSDVQTFELLLEKGASIEVKNAKGETPFDLCLQNYTAGGIRSILSSKIEWASIVLSDNKTKLTDVVSAMEMADRFISFLDSNKSVLTAHIPFDSPLWPGYTLLHLAVVVASKISDDEVTFFGQRDDTEIIDECLKRGADMTIADAKGSTALHLAFYMQKLSVVESLLDHHDKTINPTDTDNLSHFHIACAAGHLKAVDYFLSLGVKIDNPVLSTFDWHTRVEDVNIKCGTRHFSIQPGSTALHIGVVAADYEITEKLLKHGADVHARDANGFTPVHRSLACGDHKFCERVASLLLKVKHLENTTTACGLGHLHVACYFGHDEAVENLLKIGADAEGVYRPDSSPKDYDEFFSDERGTYHEPLSCLSKYVGYRPLDFLWHPRKSNDQRDNCKPFWKISFTLTKRSADAFAKNDRTTVLLRNLLQRVRIDDSYFSYAMLCKNTAIQEGLEKEFGISKLHLACYLADVKLVESAIKRGANVNAKVHSDSPIWHGHTPLHTVLQSAYENHNNRKIMNGTTKTVQLLMKHEADPLLVDDDNETPLHVINKLQFHDQHSKVLRICSLVASVFESTKNFTVNPANNYGLSHFHIACVVQSKFAVKKFLKHGLDVNLAIGDFSNFCAGSPPLHLLVSYYRELNDPPPIFGSSDKTFLQMVDALLEKGANVNATDADGETLLFVVGQSKMLRRILIEKFISKGADVYATNYKGITPFEYLLWRGDASWEEIELFLKAGCRFNQFNLVSREGYMAETFRFRLRKTFASNNIMENPVFFNILNDPEINKIDEVGRTAIHNVVSIDYKGIADDEYIRRGVHRRFPFHFWLPAKQRRRREPVYYKTTTYKEFYPDLIEQLCIRGCDIDHEDNEGKTALHLAVAFKNDRAIVPLLKNGADIDIVDQDGKTAFAYCNKIEPSDYDAWDYEVSADQSYYGYDYENKVFAMHVYKLEFCGQRVSDRNKRLQVETLEILGPIVGKAKECFLEEVEKTKNLSIGTTPFLLYDFLMDTDTDFVYMNMTIDERREVDLFFQNIRQHNFVEIDCLLKLKYRQTIERTKLIEPSLAALNQLVKSQLPDLCCRYILNFLKNEDLKRLIASDN